MEDFGLFIVIAVVIVSGVVFFMWLLLSGPTSPPTTKLVREKFTGTGGGFGSMPSHTTFHLISDDSCSAKVSREEYIRVRVGDSFTGHWNSEG
jgi:hypothetical protein